MFLLYNIVHNVLLSRGNNSEEFLLPSPRTGWSRAGVLRQCHNSAGITNWTVGLFCKLPCWFLTIKYHLNEEAPLLEKERRKSAESCLCAFSHLGKNSPCHCWGPPHAVLSVSAQGDTFETPSTPTVLGQCNGFSSRCQGLWFRGSHFIDSH